ncbi:keratin-associated protein 5-2 [Xenopus laevis]|uniref:Keratin-associated protein 5-2 n=1 Tax=Xenopus laevis TaxID=8355 RepID=A0A8J1LR88_XENLA|nr:keratin-associated protein 5-2 [Xenopus laevis]XP_041432042.1 keratin-associated protein 5-2 [Xenopus laevis]OCT58857.1 hypothetical protein XELAEV_18001344mg [Xenopus laevis]
MAALTFPTVSASTAPLSDLRIPLPAAVFLAVSLYLVVLLILLLMHQCLRARGCCPTCLGWQLVGAFGVCDMCVSCAQSCDCRVPSITRCMDTCCPSKPNCDGCFSCCPLCDFACMCQPPDCSTINCMCCEIRLH